MQRELIISIPKGLPTAILKDGLERDFTIWYQLKSLYVGGIIKDYTKRYQELADTLGIGNSTLRKYIKRLLSYGWVTKKGKHLFFISREKLRVKYNVAKAKYKVKPNENLLEWVKVRAIKENLNKQIHAYKQKYVDNGLKDSKDKSQGLKRLFKTQLKDFDNHLSKQQERFRKDVKNGVKGAINPFITLSRLGIAKVLNRKSKYTGSYQMKKFKKANLILKDESNLLFFKSCSYYEYLKLKSINYTCNYLYKDGKVFIKLSNNILICD